MALGFPLLRFELLFLFFMECPPFALHNASLRGSCALDGTTSDTTTRKASEVSVNNPATDAALLNPVMKRTSKITFSEPNGFLQEVKGSRVTCVVGSIGNLGRVSFNG